MPAGAQGTRQPGRPEPQSSLRPKPSTHSPPPACGHTRTRGRGPAGHARTHSSATSTTPPADRGGAVEERSQQMLGLPVTIQTAKRVRLEAVICFSRGQLRANSHPVDGAGDSIDQNCNRCQTVLRV